MLDKKALRSFAANNPAPTIPQSHGLLHAQQVDYIIRTAVRIINHRRTLMLYVYDRTKAAAGDPTPVWTMFQAGGDFITLSRREAGGIVRAAGRVLFLYQEMRVLLCPGRAARMRFLP